MLFWVMLGMWTISVSARREIFVLIANQDFIPCVREKLLNKFLNKQAQRTNPLIKQTPKKGSGSIVYKLLLF